MLRIIDGAAEDAGVRRESLCRDPGVETGVLHSRADAILIVINRNPEAAEVEIELRLDGMKLGEPAMELRKGRIRVALEAGEARVIKFVPVE